MYLTETEARIVSQNRYAMYRFLRALGACDLACLGLVQWDELSFVETVQLLLRKAHANEGDDTWVGGVKWMFTYIIHPGLLTGANTETLSSFLYELLRESEWTFADERFWDEDIIYMMGNGAYRAPWYLVREKWDSPTHDYVIDCIAQARAEIPFFIPWNEERWESDGLPF